MKFYQKQIDDLVLIITGNKLPYKDILILGDNSKGKSLLLKTLVKRIMSKNDIYYIDSVNRSLIANDIPRYAVKADYSNNIINTRLKEEYFNVRDSFNCFGTLTEKIELIYPQYESTLQNLFTELTDDSFKILHDNNLGEVELLKGRGLLSNGYQAMARLLLEHIFFSEAMIKKGISLNLWMVIDEIDEYLSPRFAANIYPFLKNKFNMFNYIFSTHSMDVVLTAKDVNIVILYDQSYEVLDANDYSTVIEVKRLFERIFGEKVETEKQYDITLRRLLNNKINNAWGEDDEKIFAELGKKKLSASQKLIYKQILDWDTL